MNKKRFHPGSWAVVAGVIALLAALAWAATPSVPAPGPLAGMLPGGALMTVETTDFGALVSAWNGSPEQRSWLAGADYSAFSNSRLFTRLADAQSGFMDAAKTGLDGDFLKQVAGKESIVAWYNIGNLALLYISRLSQDRLGKLSLMAQRGSFARREIAGSVFYVRTSAGTAASAAQDTSDTQQNYAVNSLDQPRTVAFAVRGDWLLLATREDLIAGALQLMAAPRTAGSPSESQATAGWYAAAGAAAPARYGDLHMVLDLQTLTKTPQFRTYWIQRNITDTRQYRAAVVDLYREPGQFREERALLPMQPEPSNPEQPDLGVLEAVVPERAGVYRAVAHPSSLEALNALREKILLREPTTAVADVAPVAQTTVVPAGAAGDFDTRIDAPAPETEGDGEPFSSLRQVLDAAHVDSMLTLHRTDPPNASDPFVQIRSAVVLHASSPWNKDTIASALLAGLRPGLTTASLGVDWTDVSSPAGSYRTLGAATGVCLAVNGPLAILTTDPGMMEDILKRHSANTPVVVPARVVAGFRHDTERSNLRHLMTDLNLVQNTDSPAGPVTSLSPSSSPNAPTPVDLFRDNLPSLSDTFQAMTSEHFAETKDGPGVHQTVLYRWQQPSASR